MRSSCRLMVSDMVTFLCFEFNLLSSKNILWDRSNIPQFKYSIPLTYFRSSTKWTNKFYLLVHMWESWYIPNVCLVWCLKGLVSSESASNSVTVQPSIWFVFAILRQVLRNLFSSQSQEQIDLFRNIHQQSHPELVLLYRLNRISSPRASQL